MFRLNECRPKNQDRDADDGADFDLALLIAARFHMEPHIARLVCSLAYGDDRATASGGKAK